VRDDIDVSTVFLGINHGWDGRVALYETMVFRSVHGEECWRYATHEEAEAGHKAAVEMVKGEIYG